MCAAVLINTSVCVYICVCVRELKEDAHFGESMAANIRCCSPVVECFSDINVNYFNVSGMEHGDWRAIMLEYTHERGWERVQETRGKGVIVRWFV